MISVQPQGKDFKQNRSFRLAISQWMVLCRLVTIHIHSTTYGLLYCTAWNWHTHSISSKQKSLFFLAKDVISKVLAPRCVSPFSIYSKAFCVCLLTRSGVMPKFCCFKKPSFRQIFCQHQLLTSVGGVCRAHYYKFSFCRDDFQRCHRQKMTKFASDNNWPITFSAIIHSKYFAVSDWLQSPV